MPWIISLLKKWILVRVAAKILGSLGILIPLALVLALFGLPTLAILGVVGAPLLIVLAVIGLPLLAVLIVGGVLIGGIFMLLPLAVLVLKIFVFIVVPFMLVKWAWKFWTSNGSHDRGTPPPATSEPGPESA